MIVTRGYGSGALVTRGYSAPSSDYEFIEEFFKHIWPAKYDPLSVDAIGTKFYINGILYEHNIQGLSTTFWTNGIRCVMYIQADK